MAKFKKGDRVRCVPGSTHYMKVGQTGVIVNTETGAQPVRIDGVLYDTPNSFTYVNEDSLELITDHKPITPKVGERYRFISTEPMPAYSLEWYTKIRGGTATVTDLLPGGGVRFGKTQKGSYVGNIASSYLTTEYLELVEDEPLQNQIVSAFTVNKAFYNFDSICRWTSEPIKKPTLKQKTMNFIKKLTQSAADKSLEKASFIDSCGDLTGRGTDALLSLVYQEKKDALVTLAEQVIEDEKED